MKRMNKKILMIFAVLFVTVYAPSTANAGITNVSVSPNSPNTTDQISILVSGLEGSGGVLITSTTFLANGNLLSLDIHLDIGDLTTATPWSYSETIGTLLPGTYNLTVQRFLPSYYSPPIVDTYSMSFDVVPEPATILLLGLGVILSRKKRIR